MTDREQADALARELVASGWMPRSGMVVRALCSRNLGDGLIGPDLLHPLQAAVLAVQAMEAGIEIANVAPGLWWARRSGGFDGAEGPLGIVAAKALIALRRTDG